jgi:hypothetical protein
MAGFKLLRELSVLVETQILQEESSGKQKLYITGPFAVCEEQNKNGRVYPKGVMEEAVSKYMTEKLIPKMAWGELGHPVGPKINETLVSHLIEEAHWDGNRVMAKAQVTLGTPNGKTLAGLIESGGAVGVSTRALGQVKENSKGLMEVQSGLKFATLGDAVLDPSAPGAFVNGVMENVEWFYDATRGTWMEERIETMKKEIHQLSLREIQEKKLAFFEEYLKGLSNLQ